ncbi:MAG: MOSC N-terminal beta barrel domain-containing protein [Pseudomonadota bacterium]
MDAPQLDVEGHIARLFVYPIKSCAGVEVQDVVLTATGLEFDRAWMVVDARGEFVTQRELPQMALIRPTLRHYEMVLRAPGMLALHIALDAVEKPVTVQVWGDAVSAWDMGDVAAQWFTDFLSSVAQGGAAAIARDFGTLRLVRFDPDFTRPCSPVWTPGLQASTQFADAYPLLVCSIAALDQLNAGLAEAGHPAVGIERFRPNIVLAGLSAHDEDHIDTLAISDATSAVELRLVKPCVRCAIPDIDPASAVVGTGVGDYLLRERRDSRMDGALTWGMNAVVASGDDKLLRVGQTVAGRYRFN